MYDGSSAVLRPPPLPAVVLFSWLVKNFRWRSLVKVVSGLTFSVGTLIALCGAFLLIQFARTGISEDVGRLVYGMFGLWGLGVGGVVMVIGGIAVLLCRRSARRAFQGSSVNSGPNDSATA